MERLKITIGPRYYQHAHEIVSGAQARIKAAQRDRDRMTQSRDTWRDRALEAEAKLKAITQAIGWHQAMNTTPQGAQSAQALQSFPYEARELRDFADNGTAGRLRVMLDSIALWHESALRTALAAPPPEPEKFNLHDVVPPSAPEWVEGNRAAVSPDWMSGWDACRNRTRLLVIGLVAAMRQGLAAPEGPAPTDPLDDAPVHASYKRMFEAAVVSLAEIDRLLGVEPDGCNDPETTVSALKDYIAGTTDAINARNEFVDAQYAAPEAPPPVAQETK